MKKKKIIAIGHIVNDTEPQDHLGGSVAYISIVAQRLGWNAHIITKCPHNHPYVKNLERMGVTVHILPSENDEITTFKNIYDSNGRRTQYILAKQEEITSSDFSYIPDSLLEEAVVIIAPVISEVSHEFVSKIMNKNFLAVTPQGYFRKMRDDGLVIHTQWKNCREIIKNSNATIFSDEDITIGGKKDTYFIDHIKTYSPLFVLTEGANGATIFTKRFSYHADAFSLKPQEIRDFTGAGDTCATAFLIAYLTHHDLKKASKQACFFAALKIMGISGIGTDSIPTQQDFNKFVKTHSDRVQEYLAE